MHIPTMKVPLVDDQRRARLGFFLAGNVLVGSGLFFHAFLYNFYLGAHELDESVMGLAAAALTAGGLLALLPSGRLVDRVGLRVTLLGAAGCAAVGLAASALVAAPSLVYLTSFLAGAGAVAWRVSMAPFIMRAVGQGRRSRILSLNVALLVASGAVWMMVGGWVADRLQMGGAFGAVAAQRVTLLAGAALTLLAAPLFAAACSAPDRPVKSSPTDAPAVDAPQWDQRLAIQVAFVALWMTAPALAQPFFNVFFARVHELGVSTIGVVFGGAHLITAVALVGSGAVAARIGPRPALAFWTLLYPAALWALAAASTVQSAIGLYVLAGLASPAANPLIDEILLDSAPVSRHGQVSSWRNGATEVAGILGATVGGLLLRDQTFGVLFGVSGAVGLLAAVLLWWALAATRRRDER